MLETFHFGSFKGGGCLDGGETNQPHVGFPLATVLLSVRERKYIYISLFPSFPFPPVGNKLEINRNISSLFPYFSLFGNQVAFNYIAHVFGVTAYSSGTNTDLC